MRVVILTQNDSFFLPENIDYLLQKWPTHSQLIGAILFQPSPFGKKKTASEKIIETLKIFGVRFFAFYLFKLGWKKLTANSSVRRVLKLHRVPIIKVKGNINNAENLDKIASLKPDLLVSVAGNQIFKKRLLDIAPLGCINVHTALLPKYRGLMPSFWVLRNNERYTGVSVFFVDEGIDSGPIIVQKRVSMDELSQEQLIRKTKKIGMDCILESIDLIKKGKVSLIPNEDQEMTYFSFPTRQDVRAFKALGKRFF